jgi:hypothetical protein
VANQARRERRAPIGGGSEARTRPTLNFAALLGDGFAGLDPASTRQDLAPVRKTGAMQELAGACRMRSVTSGAQREEES